MSKLPAFQFYPGDWMKDPALRACSIAARGLWMDMLCLMFESDRRGFLQAPNGKPYSHEQLARMTGCLPDEISRLLVELESSGVFSRTAHGTIFSRRLKRDEESRADHRKRQNEYRNSFKLKENGDAHVTHDMTHLSQPSSSSASSSIQHEESTTVDSSAKPTPLKVLGTLPLNSGEDYAITEPMVEQWKLLYPAVDVLQECRSMKGWCIANPSKRKTKSGIVRFINRWLADKQDKSGTHHERGYARRHGELPDLGAAFTPEAVAAREKAEEAKQREAYEMWHSMSPAYKQANPWRGAEPA